MLSPLTDRAEVGRVHRRRACSLKDLVPNGLGNVRIDPLSCAAPWVQIASKIDIAVALDKVKSQGAESGSVVMERRVDVPGHEEASAVGVDEGDRGREVVVVFYDVGEISHSLVAFVERSLELSGISDGGFGGIDDVDGLLPAARVSKQSSRGKGQSAHTLAAPLGPIAPVLPPAGP